MTDTPLSDDVLLPCPFCGFEGSDYVGLTHVETYGRNDHRIRCGRCRAATGSHLTHEQAIAAWNTRHALEAARYGEMRGALQSIADAEDWNTTDRLRSIARLVLNRSGTRFCPTCGGEFDAAEWDASSNCPECETPKARALLSSIGAKP